jgi:hypothetical protein
MPAIRETVSGKDVLCIRGLFLCIPTRTASSAAIVLKYAKMPHLPLISG